MFGMKFSPGKRQLRVLHRLRGFRKTTVFPYRNRLDAKKPQTGAGWLRLFLESRLPEGMRIKQCCYFFLKTHMS
jgi:hypothetical protein